MSLKHLMVLFQYNEFASLTLLKLEELCGIEQADVDKIIKNFVELGLIVKNNDSFDLNMAFTKYIRFLRSKRLKLKMSSLSQPESKVESDQLKKSVNDDRRFYIQALIVRVMKKRGGLSHNLLIEEARRTNFDLNRY